VVCGLGTLGIVYLERHAEDVAFDGCDLDRLMAVSAAIAPQVERIVRKQVSAPQVAARGQTALIREVQARLDPSAVPQWPAIQLSVYCKPGTERAGNVFDLMSLPNGLAMLFVGNVHGESFRTAMAMVEARSAFRMAGLHLDAPHTFLRSLNWLYCEDPTPTSMTAVVLAMNPATGEMQFSAAGEAGMIIVDALGEARQPVRRDIPPVGSAANHPYEAHREQLGVDETMVLYTPGATAVRNAAGEPLGVEALLESVCDSFGQPASVVLNDLIQDHQGHFKEGVLDDDITIMVIHHVGASP